MADYKLLERPNGQQALVKETWWRTKYYNTRTGSFSNRYVYWYGDPDSKAELNQAYNKLMAFGELHVLKSCRSKQ